MKKSENSVRKLKNHKTLSRSFHVFDLTACAMFLALLFCISTIQSNAYAQDHSLTISSPPVVVSVSFGEPRMTIFGYTSPGALVKLEGQGVFDEVYADNNGYFIFDNRFAPKSSHEICLTAFDTNGGSSQPSCLPPLPPNRNVKIGPVILPPIVFINKLLIEVNDFAVIHGTTVPNTDVTIYSYSSDITRETDQGIPLPKITTTSNGEGQFSVSVPTNTAQKLRVFSQAEYSEQHSGKSTTLSVEVLPFWLLLVKRIMGLLSQLGTFVMPVIILLELGFILWFLFVRHKKRHELMVIENHDIVQRNSRKDQVK